MSEQLPKIVGVALKFGSYIESMERGSHGKLIWNIGSEGDKEKCAALSAADSGGTLRHGFIDEHGKWHDRVSARLCAVTNRQTKPEWDMSDPDILNSIDMVNW